MPKDDEIFEPRDLRIRRQYFPDGDELVFHTSQKGFVPVPILLRKLMRHLSAPELRILTYLYLRSSRYSICYPTLEEIAFEVGLSGRKNLIPHIKSLVEKGIISTHQATGRNFYLIHDPRIALSRMVAEKKISAEELLEINSLCEDLRQQPITASNVQGSKNRKGKRKIELRNARHSLPL